MENKIINLDECVINALNLFIADKVPILNLNEFKRPLVVGSGNAAVTGKIIMEDRDAIFADESTFIKKLRSSHDIDGAVLISSSGKKHAPIIARELKRRGIKVVLLTNNKNSSASTFSKKVYLFPKKPEPYTYNTSTYLGMILAKTKEKPYLILDFLNKLDKKIPKNLDKFDSFFIIIPQEFESIREMFMNKFDELFGAKISVRVFTPEQAKHAKTIVQSDKELFVGLGYKNNLFGRERLNLPLPKKAGYAALMAVGYYFIGNIQKQNKPYFKKSIKGYLHEYSKIFGEKTDLIV